VRSLPVVEKQELVGMLTLADQAADAEISAGEGNGGDEVTHTVARLSSRPPPPR
jgi:hypothetical protein